MDWLPTFLLLAQLASLGTTERRIIDVTSETNDDVSSLHHESSTFSRSPVQIVRTDTQSSTEVPANETPVRGKLKFIPPRFSQDNFGSRIVPLSRRPESTTLIPDIATSIPRQRSREKKPPTVATSPRSTIHRVVGGHVRIRTTSTTSTIPPPITENTIPNGEETKENTNNNNDDDESKTLSQQVADGKYGLIQELFRHRPKRPGIISYADNEEVPNDVMENLGGLNPKEIWLSEGHVLVLKGGYFPDKETFDNNVWKPIDDYEAPPRQVKIPANPSVPPPFPIQLYDGGPTEFIGGNPYNNSRFPFLPFPIFPPPGNFTPGSGGPMNPPFPFFPQGFRPQNGTNLGPYPPPTNTSRVPLLPPSFFFPQGGNGSKIPPYPPPLFFPPPNNGTPFRPPFFPGAPPQGLPPRPPIPPENLTDIIDDDPSIFYPPPYDFYYPQDNTTEVPPGPLVPGIVLPPPPNFFAPLENDTYTRGRRPQVRPTLRPTPENKVRGNTITILDRPTPRPPSNQPPTKRPYYSYNSVTTPSPPPRTTYYITKDPHDVKYGTVTPAPPKPQYNYPSDIRGHKGKVQSPEITIIERPNPPVHIITTSKKVVPPTRPVYIYNPQKVTKGGVTTTTATPVVNVNLPENVYNARLKPKPYYVYEPPRPSSVYIYPETNTKQNHVPPSIQPYYIYNDPSGLRNVKTSTTTTEPPVYYYLNPGTKGRPSARPVYANKHPDKVKITTASPPIYYYSTPRPVVQDKIKPSMKPIIVYEDPRVLQQVRGQTPTTAHPPLIIYNTPGTIDNKGKPSPHPYYVYEDNLRYKNIQDHIRDIQNPQYYRTQGFSGSPHKIKGGVTTTITPPTYYYNGQSSPSPAVPTDPSNQYYQNNVTPKPLYLYNLPAKTSPETTNEPQYYYVLTGNQGQNTSPSPVPSYVYLDPNNQHNYKQNLVSPKPDYPNNIKEFNTVTDAPISSYFTPQDVALDDITKQYFSVFGQKLQGPTTPLPTVTLQETPVTDGPVKKPIHPTSYLPYRTSTVIPLHDDILVNYKKPLPHIHPQSEYVTPVNKPQQNVHGVPQGSLVSYDLPGGNGGHYYFLTPQAILRRTVRNKNIHRNAEIKSSENSNQPQRQTVHSTRSTGQFSTSGD